MTMVELPQRRALKRGKLAAFRPSTFRPSTFRLGAFSLAVAFAVGATAGCGDDGLAEVNGTVAVDGEPAKVGAVTFIPISGGGQTAGAKIVDGGYTARVSPGNYKVEMRVSKVVGERKMYDSPDAPLKQVLSEALPPKYNDRTELTLDVKPGVNEKNYDLQSK